MNLAVCWNGDTLQPFTLTRGLRQGEPFSPFCIVYGSIRTIYLQCGVVWRVETSHYSSPRTWYVTPFFADDLILCGEASFSQARKMEHLLATFCGFSGQRMNQNKSWIWFSPNTPHYLQNVIRMEFGVLPTVDLGTYLGMPLLHGRLRKNAYQCLINKVVRQLSRWKWKTLSKASQAMLIRSTLEALSVYAMHSVIIPKGIITQLDKLCKGFFWGHSNT